MSAWRKYDLPENSFLLPREVFELGLERGALLVYLFLIHHEYLKHGTDRLSCTTIGKAIGLCAKTVSTHLRTLTDDDLVRMEGIGKSFSYTLCPIHDKARGRRGVVLLPTHEGGLSA